MNPWVSESPIVTSRWAAFFRAAPGGTCTPRVGSVTGSRGSVRICTSSGVARTSVITTRSSGVGCRSWLAGLRALGLLLHQPEHRAAHGGHERAHQPPVPLEPAARLLVRAAHPHVGDQDRLRV